MNTKFLTTFTFAALTLTASVTFAQTSQFANQHPISKDEQYALSEAQFNGLMEQKQFSSLHEIGFEYPGLSLPGAGPIGSIAFEANRTFDLRSYTGTTYITFVKSKVKPVLDALNIQGFNNVGAANYRANQGFLDKKTLLGYQGQKWNGKGYSNPTPEADIVKVFETLKSARPHSTVETLTYYNDAKGNPDPQWTSKNDMAVAINTAGVRADTFALANLYALTSGIGVKVKLDDNNYNYHVLYLDGKGNPNKEVMSGRSFAASPEHGASDATDPEYLKALQAYLSKTPDHRPFYTALIMTLASSDTSGWHALSTEGQSLLSDFLTVYTAEADRHLMVNLDHGNHPWEIDLAAVTAVSAVSNQIGKAVVEGKLVPGDLGRWFAPSPRNEPGKPHRSGIGITRKDRQKFQRALHKYEMSTKSGAQLIAQIQALLAGDRTIAAVAKYDIIQAVFEYLSNPATPQKLGANAAQLASLMATLIQQARVDATSVGAMVDTVQ